MCRRKVTLGLVSIAFGLGLLLATIFPAGFLVFIFAAVLMATGFILLKW